MHTGNHNMIVFQLLLLFLLLLVLHASILVTGLSISSNSNNMATRKSIVRIPQQIWRQAADQHQRRIRELLQPGLTPWEHVLNTGKRRNNPNPDLEDWTSLDPKHPVYNFLVEYYGLKGSKGPKRLARWSPSPGLLLQEENTQISSMEQFEEASYAYAYAGEQQQPPETGVDDVDDRGVLLEGANEDDFASILQLRGATFLEDQGGVLYNPSQFFGKYDLSRREANVKQASPYLWYRSILTSTLQAEPILHCHGLHEWAMQYYPEGSPPPPSGKYQSHMSLRVSREVINQAVERRGVSCTHIDALRFFAPAAGPLNHHGSSLERTDQLRLEQPACVHAHMDLLKIALKLRPFCDALLIQRVLEVALESRRLDVAASPYDVTDYGVDVIPIETKKGRAEYRAQQTELMAKAEPIRRDLLRAYETVLALGFHESTVETADRNPQPERFAKAEPGGLPWRQNLITSPSA
jgi:hypothetical protein